MATVKQYIDNLWSRQQVIARKFGVDISQSSKEARVMNLALLCLIGVVIKTLVDKGVITDAELIATLNTARDDAYDNQPMEPPIPPVT